VEPSGSSPEEEDADTHIPERTEGITDSEGQYHLPEGLTAPERFWADRSDQALEEAARNLLDYTEKGQELIRAELEQRSIPLPVPDDDEEEEIGQPLSGKRVYSSPILANVAILEAALTSRGIACEIRGAYLGGASGGLPPTEAWPELWLLDESMVDKAKQIVEDTPLEVPTGSPWTCPECREEVESQFSECWNCGFERPLGSKV
jgi:hypothetical protein